MLLIGLPGVIALGFGFAVLMFDALSLYEAAILATMLAATDAALGKAVEDWPVLFLQLSSLMPVFPMLNS
jgi:hypothetical protein